MMRAVLFGFRKGWFLWTPLAFTGLLGYLFYLKKNIFAFFSFTVFFLAVTYVLSCWWCYSYGSSFGAREFIEFLAFPAIGFVLLFRNLASKRAKYILGTVCILFVGLNQLQAYQYKHFILLWDDMNEEKYWKVFARTGNRYQGFLWKYIDFHAPDSAYIPNSAISEKYINDFERPEIWSNNEVRDSARHHSGQWSNYTDRWHPFGAGFGQILSPQTRADDSIVQASVWVNGELPLSGQLIVSFTCGQKNVGWHYVNIDLFAKDDNTWAKCVIHSAFPPVKDSADKISIFIWDEKANERIYIDDFEVDIIKRKNKRTALQ